MDRKALLSGQDAHSTDLRNDSPLDRLMDDLLVFPMSDGGSDLCELMVGAGDEFGVRRVRLGGLDLHRVDGLVIGVLGLTGPGVSVRDAQVFLDTDDSVEPSEFAEAMDGCTAPCDDAAEVADALARAARALPGVRGAVALLRTPEGLIAGSAGSLTRMASLALTSLVGESQVRVVLRDHSAVA